MLVATTPLARISTKKAMNVRTSFTALPECHTSLGGPPPGCVPTECGAPPGGPCLASVPLRLPAGDHDP